jgi:hypothetical protein
MRALRNAWARLDLCGFVVMLLAVFAVALDIFITFVGQTVPDAVGRVICAMRPLNFFGRALIRQEWFDYVNAQCAAHPIEPAISIIGFTLKTSIAVVVVVVIVGETTIDVWKQGNNVSLVTDYASKKQSAFDQVKSILGPTVFFCRSGGC